ncbi:MAG: hypothetical protein PQJ60_00570 [Spirochaetales bacterium]|nr:hypothetical protein [Spirochaetales bacterium]
MKSKIYALVGTIILILASCDIGSGEIPDLTLDSYRSVDRSYSGTFTHFTTDTVVLSEPLNFEADLTILIDGAWNFTVDGEGNLTGSLEGSADLSYGTDRLYEAFLPADSSSSLSAALTGAVTDGTGLFMSCSGITLYDVSDSSLTFAGTVLNGMVAGAWDLEDSLLYGTFEGERE